LSSLVLGHLTSPTGGVGAARVELPHRVVFVAEFV
jgi:hypothetical protein